MDKVPEVLSFPSGVTCSHCPFYFAVHSKNRHYKTKDTFFFLEFQGNIIDYLFIFKFKDSWYTILCGLCSFGDTM